MCLVQFYTRFGQSISGWSPTNPTEVIRAAEGDTDLLHYWSALPIFVSTRRDTAPWKGVVFFTDRRKGGVGPGILIASRGVTKPLKFLI